MARWGGTYKMVLSQSAGCLHESLPPDHLRFLAFNPSFCISSPSTSPPSLLAGRELRRKDEVLEGGLSGRSCSRSGEIRDDASPSVADCIVPDVDGACVYLAIVPSGSRSRVWPPAEPPASRKHTGLSIGMAVTCLLSTLCAVSSNSKPINTMLLLLLHILILVKGTCQDVVDGGGNVRMNLPFVTL